MGLVPVFTDTIKLGITCVTFESRWWALNGLRLSISVCHVAAACVAPWWMPMELFNVTDYRDLHFHALNYICPVWRDIVDRSLTDSMQLTRGFPCHQLNSLSWEPRRREFKNQLWFLLQMELQRPGFVWITDEKSKLDVQVLAFRIKFWNP